MTCNTCGNEFEGNFCSKCGAKAQEDKTNRFEERIKESFIEPDEELVSVLGTNTAKTFLSTGVLGNGFAVLSDRRMYFKGRCYIRAGKGFYKKMEERVVDLDDITGTGFQHNKNVVFSLLFKFSACLAFHALILWFIYLQTNKKWAFTAALVLSGPLCWLFYFLDNMYNYSLFEVSYAGGGIAFDLSWITKADSDAFQKALQKAKSDYKKKKQEEHKYVYTPPVGGTNNEKSIPELLREYKDLLDSGVITQDEFETKKKELLSK